MDVYLVIEDATPRESDACEWNEPRSNVSRSTIVSRCYGDITRLTLADSAGACGITRTIVLSRLDISDYTGKEALFDVCGRQKLTNYDSHLRAVLCLGGRGDCSCVDLPRHSDSATIILEKAGDTSGVRTPTGASRERTASVYNVRAWTHAR